MTDSLISPKARIGQNVRIGYGTRIYDAVEIGDGSMIGDCCVIGCPAGGEWAGKAAVIGASSTIRSHSVVYEGAQLGERLEVGHHTLIRDGTRAGKNLRVGSFSDVEGDCDIGDFCRFHSYAHVGRGSRIGHFVWLYSLVTLLNDPLPPSSLEAPVTIEDGVVICMGSIVMPGTRLGLGSFAVAGTRVSGDIPPGAVVEGPDSRIASHVTFLVHFESGKRHPWMSHYRDRYPADAHARIEELGKQILATPKTFS